MVKQKGLKEFLEEDETLKQPMAYEDFNCVKHGFDDSGIEYAYNYYIKMIEKDTVS